MTIPPDMQSELKRFTDERKVLLQSFVSELEKELQPPVLYHYTDDVGLKGILESGALWLTDVANLNDPSEVNHGFSLAADILNQRAAEGPPEVKEFAREFQLFLTEDMTREAAHCFVGCFSGVDDDLGQWRAYADDGRGFALAFDREPLAAAFKRGPIQKISKTQPSESPMMSLGLSRSRDRPLMLYFH